jgi:hypothetical protein
MGSVLLTCGPKTSPVCGMGCQDSRNLRLPKGVPAGHNMFRKERVPGRFAGRMQSRIEGRPVTEA